jgi:hypothetical protein
MQLENFIEVEDPSQGGTYEPSKQELDEYLGWLGGNAEEDQDLAWVALEALRAPIPPGWKLYTRKDGSGEPFYFNIRTGESLWDHPQDEEFKARFREEKQKKLASGKPSQPRPSGKLALTKAATPPSARIGLSRPTSSPPIQLLKQLPDADEEEEESSFLLSGEDESSTDSQPRPKLKRRPESVKPQASFDAEKGKLQAAFASEKQTMQANFESEKRKMLSGFESEKASLRQQFEAEKEQLTTEFEAELNELRKAHKEKKQALARQADLSEEKERIEEDHRLEIERLSKRHAVEIAKLKQQQEHELLEVQQEFDPDRQLNELRQQFLKKKRELEQRNEAELEELAEAHESDIAKRRRQQQFEAEADKRRQQQTDAKKQELEKEMQDQLSQLQKQHERNLAKEKRRQQRQLEQAEESLAHELELRKAKHDTDVLKVETQLRKDLEARRAKLEGELQEELAQTRKTRFDEAKRRREKELIDQMRSSFESQKHEVEEAQASELAALRAAHEREMTKLRKKHEGLIDRENEEFAQQQQLTQNRHDTEKKRLESQLRRDLEASRVSAETKFGSLRQSTLGFTVLESRQSDPGRPPSEAPMELDERAVHRFRKLELKLEKVRASFDTSYGGVESTMNDTLAEITAACQAYRNLIVEQNRAMLKMAADFQQQIGQLTRAFHQQLADMEQAYRASYAFAQQPALPIERRLRRRRLAESTTDETYDEEEESEADRKVQLWRADGKRKGVRRAQAREGSE